jgi:aminocarboxymuconate-semialdehyde decarboxylase
MTRNADSWLFTLEGWRNVRIARSSVDIPERLKIMDQQGVDIEALALTTPMVNWAPPDLAVKLSRVYNDSTSAVCREHPTRFVGCVSLPLIAPERAVEELDRAVKLPGIRAVSMPTGVRGKELDDPSFLPLYRRCEQLSLPVLLHPVETLGRERTAKFYLENLLGNPYDTGLAAARLIFGGVMDMFPKLEVMLPHGGGTFPALVGRLNRGVEQRDELKHMKKPASAYLRRFTYDTIVHDDALLMNLIRLVGADRIVLGSDFPFDMGYDRPVEVVERLTTLSAADRDQILGGTAAKLFRIGG